MSVHKTVGTLICEARERHGRTQKDLAQEVGISPQYWNDIEHDRRVPPPETVVRIAKVFGMHPPTLVWFWVRQQIGDDLADAIVASFQLPAQAPARPAGVEDA